ncbi:MAG: hypothetical protein NTY64_05455 [Deltaproteobacteria bacterium]|nr:hypothetical protein [Deltaproteobacteria bacterium]
MASQKVHLWRCAASLVIAPYNLSTPHSSVPLRAGLRAGSRETRESFLLCHPL